MSKIKACHNATLQLRLLMLLSFFCAPLLVQADWKEDIGYDKLVSALGPSLPNGAGISFSLVEAPQGSANGPYFPDTTRSQFSSETDPTGTAVTFVDGSGAKNRGSSIHASDQAQTILGNTFSLAPATNHVTVYEANDYLNDVLQLNQGDPLDQEFQVQNFSWVGTFANLTDSTPEPTPAELNSDRQALRRFDYLIDTFNITAPVGVNNNTNPLPHFMSHSYNALAVGRSDGTHSSGLTHLEDYGVGRSKPEIVSPLAAASAATSTVSSAALFLHSSETVIGTDAAQSQTMKAMLMAGATKDEFPSWSQIDSLGAWHPLDDTYGAGELNVYNSYLMTLAGQTTGSTVTPTPANSHGWDFQTIQPGTGNEVLYNFVVPTGSTAQQLSIVLAWNAKIGTSGSNPNFNSGEPIFADLNLELVDATDTPIDLDIHDTLVDGLSESEVDNVEHLYLTDLPAGTYTLKVSSEDLASDYALAWRTSTLFDTFSADFDSDGDVDGVDFLTLQQGYGTLLTATRADGDTNGDGHVDNDDLEFFNSQYSSSTISTFVAAATAAVPEPASGALFVAGSTLLVLWHGGRLRRRR